MQVNGNVSGRKIQAAVPNMLTASRLVFTVFFLIYMDALLVVKGCALAALLLFACICITDYYDGRLARKLGAATNAGAIFDAATDCIYVWSSVFLLVLFDVVPIWFLVLVVYKFVEFLVTSHIFKARDPQQKKPLVFDPTGKAAAILFFLLPGASCIAFNITDIPQMFIIWCLIAAASALAVYSSIKRIGSVMKAFA